MTAVSSAASTAEALLEAARTADWPAAADIVDRSWIALTLTGHLDAIGRVVASMPEEQLLDPPTAGLIAENIGRLPPGAVRFALPEDADQLGAIGRSPRAEAALSRCLAAMAGRRRRGQHDNAMTFVRRGARIAEAAEFVGFRAVDELLPFWHLQAGITAHLAGDATTARRLHRAAYRGRDRSCYDIVGRDAAGNLAMIEALEGRLAEAEAWLDRADAESHAPVWVGPLIEVPSIAAAGLLAVDRLDPDGCRGFTEAASVAVDHDEHWAALLQVRIMIELVRGDLGTAQEVLARARVAHRQWVGESGFGAAVLGVCEAEVAMALGRALVAHRALDALPMSEGRAVVSRARLALLEGEHQEAGEIVRAAVDSPAVVHRDRIELELIGAVVDAAAGAEASAARRLEEAVRLTREDGVLRAFATVPRALLDTYAGRVPGLAEVVRRLDGIGAREIYPESIEAIRLTAREQDLLERLDSESTLDQIAGELFVSRNTMKTHMRSLRRKLDARSRAEVVRRAWALGLFASERS